MPPVNTPFLSVIVPVYNEGGRLLSCIQHVFERVGRENQVIVVDGGSVDESIHQIKELAQTEKNLHVISAPKSRAIQMNAGAKIATAGNLLFLHADTLLPESVLPELMHFSTSKYLWGRFDVRLDHCALPYKIISWFINKRSRLTAIATGDQAIFIHRDLFEKIHGFVEQPLMEDIELTVRLKKISQPYCIKIPVITSARKWEKEGVYKTVWLMWRIRAAYALGMSPEELAKIYYKH
ncbi:MAG: rSAM/selenodomain-associated transferase 2 [Pseudohongiellaceae bacterium]|jgi:rSAM/selenodomain-associated transferase 2